MILGIDEVGRGPWAGPLVVGAVVLGGAAIDGLADATASAQATAERQVLATLEAGCTAPVAAYAQITDEAITLTGGVFALDGSAQIVETAVGDNPVEVGQQVAAALLGSGAAELMN